jgi:serpin B
MNKRTWGLWGVETSGATAPPIWGGALFMAGLSAFACDGDPADTGTGGGDMHGGQTGDEFNKHYQRLEGDTERLDIEGPAVGSASQELLEFAWAFYLQAGDQSKNFVYSPYSMTTAASMLYAGAAGNTQAEVGDVFRFSPDGEAFHQARNDLMQYLDARNVEATANRNAQILKVTNDFWMAQRLMVKQDFLNTLSSYYGAPVHVFDIGSDALRREINAKISADTNDLIPELLPENSILDNTIFVLTNALYFKARWEWEFNKDETMAADFLDIGGETDEVQMMHVSGFDWGHKKVGEVDVVSIPYSGREIEFVAMLPPEGEFESFAAGLNAATVETLTSGLESVNLDLYFPKMDVATEVPLTDELKAAGMIDAWEEDAADFSSLGENHMWLSEAYHQTKIVLDEEGTEAAAATAFVGVDESAPPTPVPVTFNRPFVFFIRDVETQAVLFVGHYTNPVE